MPGLDWLQFLREYDLGGILADDMGLGRTVQALDTSCSNRKADVSTAPAWWWHLPA